MGWFRRWREARVARRTQTAPSVQSERREEPFSTSEDDDRPVALSGDLEVRAGRPATERLSDAFREMRIALDAPEVLDLLEDVEHKLSSERLVLPPMPETVLRIQQLLDDPNCGIDELSEEIERDPALATKTVGIANSPFYAGMDSIDSVRQALIRIGLREVRNIVLVISLRSKVFRVPGFEGAIAELWQHSLATSLAARELAAAVGQDPEAAQLLGLIHDTGRVVFLMLAGSRLRERSAEFASLVQLAESALHEPLTEMVAGSWNLAPDLVQALAYHHHPEQAPDSARAIARLLATADALAHAIVGAPEELADRVEDDPDLQARSATLGLDPRSLLSIAAEVAEALESMEKLV